MKSKKVTYFLGLVVLVVWGVIIYRIIRTTTDNNESDYDIKEGKISKEPYNDYNIPADTTHLLLNYRDPFSLKKQADTIKRTIVKVSIDKMVRPLIKQPFNWNFIKYSGYIKNPASKKLVAVMTINGKAAMLAEGESADQVKLIKNLQDSIKIIYNGKTTFIKMRSDAL